MLLPNKFSIKNLPKMKENPSRFQEKQMKTSKRAAIKMQSSLPTLSLQRFYLSRTLQTPRQALREQESTLPSRVWKLRQRQLQEGLPGARSHSPAGEGFT